MFKYSVSLRQHTPIIHFEPKQAGATLRATELKPKLDRFFLQRNKTEMGANPQWYIPGGKGALDYKIRIKSPKMAARQETNLPMYFGNMGDTKSKAGVYYESNLTLEIVSFHDSLLDRLTPDLPEFLATHNFGTRQSKGYGSFYISPEDASHFKPVDSSWFDYSFVSKSGDYEGCLKDIDLFHKAIRGGINFGGVYAKSLLFCYFKSPPLNIQWGKRKIKEKFYYNDGYAHGGKYNGYVTQKAKYRSDELDSKGRKEHMVRDLLGFSASESWRYYDDVVSKKIDGVDRYKSPVLYKPVRVGNQFKVWILLDQSNQLIGRNIEVHSQKKSTSFILSIPNTFSINSYFDFLSDVDMRSHLGAKTGGYNAKSLIRIFNTLSKS